MFNKPYGCVSARTDNRYPTVIDYFKELNNPNLSPVGRLDRETEGLLLVTDDGKWNQSLMRPEYHVPKTYEFIALGILTSETISQLENGILLKGAEKLTAPATVTVTKNSILSEVLPTLHPELQRKTAHNRPAHPVVFGKITITEGKKHQVRRMLKAVGCCIIYLRRVSIGRLVLDKNLDTGEWKELFLEELEI